MVTASRSGKSDGTGYQLLLKERRVGNGYGNTKD